MMTNFPEYYKTISFVNSEGKEFIGYLEPPFSDEDNPWFSVENSRDERQGVGGIMFHPDDIVTWKYI